MRIYKMVQLLIPFFLVLGCSEQDSTDTLGTDDPKKLTSADIEGHWKFVSAVKAQGTPFLKLYPNPNTPAQEVGPPEPPYIGPDFIFEKDSVYQLVYPTHIYRRNGLSMDSGYLHVHWKWNFDLFPIELNGDTLFIYKPFYSDEYVKEGYVKTSFNDSIVDILKTNPANYPELGNMWQLVRFSSGGDGTYYELDFPHEIADTMEITRNDFLEAIEKGNTMAILTDGELRDYTFIYSWGDLLFTSVEPFDKGDNGFFFEQMKTR